MTEAGQKKLYEWYVKSGQKERAETILKSYPQFKEVKETEKTKKSK